MTETKLTPEERKRAAEARRALLREEHTAAHAEQEAADMERVVDLEDEHGFDRVLRINLRGWKAGSGAATLVAARIPLSSERVVKRFEDTVSKPKAENLKALHLLAESCLIYPSRKDEKELYDATLELAPGLLSNVGHAIVEAVQGKVEEEKKD